MELKRNKAAMRRFLAGSGALVTALAVTWGLAVAPVALAQGDDADGVPEEKEFSLEQLLTPLGGSEPDAFKGAAVADLSAGKGDPDEIVTIVVQLDEGQQQASPSPFSLFGLGQQSGAPSHDSVRSQIRDVVDGSNAGGLQLFGFGGGQESKVEEVGDFYNVIDGFVIKAPRGSIDEINAIAGVKNAYEDEVYTLPDEGGFQAAEGDASGLVAGALTLDDSDDGIENGSTLSMTGADKVDYRGEGQVIAIVDSGLQTNHEAFTGDLDDSKVAFTQSAIASAKAGLAQGGKNAKYVSEKIIFCYDYADNDNEVTPQSGEDLSHGTHVAGIAAANAGKIQGTAPDAQIMMLKVCDDFAGNIKNSDMLRAFDDIVALDAAAEAAGNHGIDSMNLSIGSNNGFSAAAADTFEDAVQAIEGAGITANIAAGNAYSSAYANNSGANLPYASDPDAGIVSSPSTKLGAVSVASVNSAKGSACFFFDGAAVAYQQLTVQDGSATAQFADIADGSYRLVDGGIGSTDDVAKVKAANKDGLAGAMVLVQRGGEENGEPITFQKKAEGFKDLKPAAVIVYDNVSELTTNFGLSTGLDVPVVGISLENGRKMAEALAGAGDGKVEVTTKAGSVAPDADFGSYTMSDFSSWGSSPEMDVKPEVAAPGGNVYSAVTGGTAAYAYMSGTSMATPQMAGISAQISQYIASDPKFAGLDATARHELVTQLLMSTAKPMDEPGDGASYYPVRQQGAGLADVQAAISTPVYLTVDGAAKASRPKAELGESPSGTWTFGVTLHNLTGEAVTYAPEAHATSDQVEGGLFRQNTKDWTGQGISVSYGGAFDAASGTVTVPANGTATYTVTVACEDAFTSWAAANTPNGTFVEGFALLKAQTDGAVDLSTPFLGFYGDWDAVPAFDATYESGAAHVIGSLAANGNTGTPLGINPLDSVASAIGDYTGYINDAKLVVSDTTWSSSPSSLVPMTGLLRSVVNYTATYSDALGNAVRTYDEEYVGKSFYFVNAGYVVYAEQLMSELPAFDGKDDAGKRLPDGKYSLRKSVTTAGGDGGVQAEEGTVEFYYDTSKPKISDVEYAGEGDERTVSFKVTDSSWLAAVQVCDPESGGYFWRSLVDDANGDGTAQASEAAEESFVENADGTRTWSFSIKVADLVAMWDSYDTGLTIPNTVKLYAWDYGLNGSDAADVVVNPVPATGLSIAPSEMKLYAGQEGTFDVTVEPENATEKAIDWTSSDTSIATVADGKVHAVKNGTATITARMAASESVAASAVVTVTDVPEDEGIAMATGEMTLAYNATANVSAVLAPEWADEPVTWTTSDKGIADVASEGNTAEAVVTAFGKTGDATITATATHDGVTRACCLTVKVRSVDYGDFVIDEDYAEGPRLLYYAGYQTDVTVPDNVKVIGPQAFAGCSPTTVTIPASVEKIEYQAFTQMEHLQHVYFVDTDENPSQLREMGDEVFYYTLALQDMELPRNLKKLGTGTFKTSSVTRVVMPEGLKVIPDETFYYNNLADVTISDRVTSIGRLAFASNNLSEIKLVGTAEGPDADGNLPTGLPSSLITVGDSAFIGFGADEIVLPDYVTSIGRSAFESTAATKVVLNDGLRDIGARAFAINRAAELVIPDSVVNVGGEAFVNMVNCKSFTIGRNVAPDSLDSCFYGDSACVEFVAPDDCVNYKAVDGVLFTKDGGRLISINEGARENGGSYAVPEGTRDLSAYSFFCTKLANVEMPESLRNIGASAFDSSNITSLKLPEEFDTVYNAAFHTCTKLESLDIGGAKRLMKYSFYCCTSLVNPNLRCDLNRLEVIDEGAFTECAAIKEFVFPDSLTAINGMGMINMPSLQKVHIGAGLTSSLAGAFTGDPNLSEITVSEGNLVYHAANNVLYGEMTEEADANGSGEFPAIAGKHLFLSLPTNTFGEYVVEDGTVAIDAQAFRNNKSLRKVVLPEGLKQLRVGSFNGCSALEDIAFPDSLEYVDGLYSVSKLKTADFGTKVKRIAENAFLGDLPDHLVVRGGQDGAYEDSMDFGDSSSGAETAYFGPGMKSVKFSYNTAPNTLVVSGDLSELELTSPSAGDLPNFYIYAPAGTDGEKAAKKALEANSIGESHLRDYQALDATLAIGDPAGDDQADEEQVKSYAIGATWLKTGTDEESSVKAYLGSTVYARPAGNGKFRVTFAPAAMYASMITDMMYGGANGTSMERDGGSFAVIMTAEQLKEARHAIGFKINTGAMAMTQEADVVLNQAAVQNMIDDVAAANTGNSVNQMELQGDGAGEPEATVTAGGVVTTFDEVNVWVKATGGVKSAREYRFVETDPDGAVDVVKDWSNDRSCTWEPVSSGAMLTAEVRDATMLTAEAAGVVRALDEGGQEALGKLDDLIAQLELVDTSLRSDEANAALADAIAAAKEVAGNGNATPDQLQDALAALEKARDAYQATPTVNVTEVAGSWFKNGTYGTDRQETSMVSGMVEPNVGVHAPQADGTFAIDVRFNEQGASFVRNVKHGDDDAVRVGAVYRVFVSKDELTQPIPLAFTYMAGTMGEMTHTADLVLDAAAVKELVAVAEAFGNATAAIAALPDAAAVDAGSGDAVRAAQAAYAALSDEQKKELPAEDVARLDAAGAAYATALVNGLGDNPSRDEVAAARAAVDALSDAAADLVSVKTYRKLEAAEQVKVDLSTAGASITVAKATYTGKALKPKVTVKVGGKTLQAGTDFTVVYANNTKVGTGWVAVTGKGAYEGSVLKSFAIAKAANPMKASAKTTTVKFANVKKANQTIKAGTAFTVKGAQGKVTYKKASGNAKVVVASNGTVTVKKGLAKGTYKVKVNVTAAGNANYNKLAKTVVLTIKVA